MRKTKNSDWEIPDPVQSWTQASVAVLMDIRDELQQLNRVFQCHNFLAIPHTLRQIKKNTTKRRKKKANR